MKINITDIEKDIIKEMVNIGLAKAADSFAAIAKDAVYINVPTVKLIDTETAVNLITEFQQTEFIVQSDIVGELNGKTLLLFITEHINNISDVCIGSRENFKGNFDEMQRSLILEVSNILTGALVTQLANLMNIKIYGSPPIFIDKNIKESLVQLITNFPHYQPFVFLVKTQFINCGKWVELPLLLIFDANSVETILKIVREKSTGDRNLFSKKAS